MGKSPDLALSPRNSLRDTWADRNVWNFCIGSHKRISTAEQIFSQWGLQAESQSIRSLGFHGGRTLCLMCHSRRIGRWKKLTGEQVVTHQPAISFSISFLTPFNRAGGRTFDVSPRIRCPFHTSH